MASINRLKRELLFKIVFYGPGLGGKTTTLRYVHAATKQENRGNMVSLATDTDRTLYFDYLPVQLLKLGDMGVKLQLYTVPGQVYYAATRKLVLSGADAIVFVADTQAARVDSNHESLDDLNANLAEQGRKLSSVPHAFQWNKRDLPDLIPVDELDRRLNLFGAPSIPTIATTGEGVFETLERVTRLAVEAYRADLPGPKTEGVPMFLDADEIGLADAIKGLTDAKQPPPPSAPRLPTEPSEQKAQPVARRAPPNNPQGIPSIASLPTPALGPPPATAGGPPAPPRTAAATPASPAAAATPQAPPGGAASLGGGAVPSAAASLGAGTSAGTSGSLGAGPALSAGPPLGATAGAASLGAQAGPPASSGGMSLADLWPASDRDAVRRAEAAIAAGDTAAAVAACEDLLSRVLASGSLILGGQSHPRDPVILVTLLGLDGVRYLGFRGVARGMRSKRPPTLRDAMECYAFALEARRALDRASRGP